MRNNDKAIDVLLQTIDRYWSQAIQSENQRAGFLNYVLILDGAVQGYIVEREFDTFCITLALLIIVVSAYGALVSVKYYERFREQATRVGRLMERIKELCPEVDLDQLERKAEEKHQKKFPKLHRIRLYKLWMTLHLLLVLLGIGDLIAVWIHHAQAAAESAPICH